MSDKARASGPVALPGMLPDSCTRGQARSHVYLVSTPASQPVGLPLPVKPSGASPSAGNCPIQIRSNEMRLNKMIGSVRFGSTLGAGDVVTLGGSKSHNFISRHTHGVVRRRIFCVGKWRVQVCIVRCGNH